MLETALAAPCAAGSDLRGDASRASWRLLLSAPVRRVALVGDVDDDIRQGLVAAGIDLAGDAIAADAAVVAPGVAATAITDRLRDAGRAPFVVVWLDGARYGRSGTRVEAWPPEGEPRCWVPADAAGLRTWFERAGLADPEATRAAARRRTPTVTRGDVVAGDARLPHPPAWLCGVAERAGLDVRDWQVGLWDRGAFATQKIVLFLAPPRASTPAIVVKVARDPDHAWRIEAERRALAALAALPNAPQTPNVVFDGDVDGLPAVGFDALHGTPFEQASSARPRDTTVRAAIEWITRLGRSTRRGIDGSVVATAAEPLVDRFAELFHAAPHHTEFLRRQLGDVAAVGEVPAVLLHGDCTPWNALVQRRGRITFMDWEFAELEGPPLWDLFYFWQHLALLGRRAGVRARLRGLRSSMFREPHASALARVTAGYCQAVGVPAAAVRPLFHLLWVRAAVKEATHLTAEALSSATYFRLSERVMAEDDGPVLRRVLSVGHAS